MRRYGCGEDPALQRGESPIYEPHLEEMLRLAQGRGGIDFTTDFRQPVSESDVIFIAVGTPPQPTGEPNLEFVETAAHSIGAALSGSRFPVVVNKSTVPVGSGNLVEAMVREGIDDSSPGQGRRARFGVASNPEFLREGSAVADSLYPDRIVVGASAPKLWRSCGSFMLRWFARSSIRRRAYRVPRAWRRSRCMSLRSPARK